MNIDLKFSSQEANDFFHCQARNQLWVSGYGSGKTWAAWQKFLVLMMTYPGYRVAACRKSRTELNRTTKQTFYKVCDSSLIARDVEGNTPETDLINGSRIYWMNVDEFSESALRSLEVNAILVDQAEEILERVYLTLDSRAGRWDQVKIPDALAPFLQINEFTGKPMAPAYHVLLANPPDEGEYSWLYQVFDRPESITVYEKEHSLYKMSAKHAFFETSSTINKALNQETLETMLTRDEEWVERYVKGKRTQGSGAVHRIDPLSILDVDEEWIKNNVLKKGAIYRVLDHGETSPTSCTWWSTFNGNHFCYREYYKPRSIISEHRRNINDLSPIDEYVMGNIADPSIFNKEPQKKGGFWSVADEYSDSSVYYNFVGDAPPISFVPADNNEFATRNRINELLRVDENKIHPVTGKKGSPSLFFCKRHPDKNPHGADKVIAETASQKKELLDTINGKPIYSDDRDSSISDHAYDTLRYYVAMHFQGRSSPVPVPKPRSFISAMKRIKARKQVGIYG